MMENAFEAAFTAFADALMALIRISKVCRDHWSRLTNYLTACFTIDPAGSRMCSSRLVRNDTGLREVHRPGWMG